MGYAPAAAQHIRGNGGMASRFGGLERALLALFVASGFAGLIYQAIWSHYLGLSLGHAAYAQTLVLAIFMGGMALGAWLVSRYGTPAVRFQKNGRVFTRPCGCCSVRWLTLMVLCSGSLNQALVEQPEMVSARSRNVARRSDDMQNVLVNRMVDGL